MNKWKVRKGTWKKQTLLHSVDVDLYITHQIFLSYKEKKRPTLIQRTTVEGSSFRRFFA